MEVARTTAECRQHQGALRRGRLAFFCWAALQHGVELGPLHGVEGWLGRAVQTRAGLLRAPTGWAGVLRAHLGGLGGISPPGTLQLGEMG